MLNTEQSVINLLSIDDGNDTIWSWLMDQVQLIAEGKSFESKKVLHEEPLESSMELEVVDGRIVVSMICFGFSLEYSWELCWDSEDQFYLGNFKPHYFPEKEDVNGC